MSSGSVFQLKGSIHYHICTHPVDMRKNFRGLMGIVSSEFGKRLESDHAYIFVGKNKRTVKVIRREGSGLLLYVRKLDEGSFCFPRYDPERNEVRISYANFVLLVMGQRIISETYPE